MDGGVIASLPTWRLFKCWELLIGLVLKLHSKSRSYVSNLLSNFLQVNHSLKSELIGDGRQVLSRRICGCGKLLLIRVRFINFMQKMLRKSNWNRRRRRSRSGVHLWTGRR